TNPRLEGALEMLPVLEVLCCAAADRGGVDWYSLCCCGRFRRTPDWRAPWRCSWCSRSSVAPPPAVGAWTGTACAAADASDEPQTGGRPGDAPGARGPLEGALEMLPVLEARAMSTDWLRPTFYWINGVVYAIQEFVAHTLNVNCAKFGRRASRILITGFTSPVESVSFDSSEVTIGAGAASGTIKIWNIEEAKVVRTFTGHKSSCASLDFHPFGEFLAIGSSDTNMKIWDTRQQRCIHTYKGHTQRINVLKFTPDGRWIVSGGADNLVK
ncbi:hypothetical protein ACJX0J_041365, partial [Zea mays]